MTLYTYQNSHVDDLIWATQQLWEGGSGENPIYKQKNKAERGECRLFKNPRLSPYPGAPFPPLLRGRENSCLSSTHTPGRHAGPGEESDCSTCGAWPSKVEENREVIWSEKEQFTGNLEMLGEGRLSGRASPGNCPWLENGLHLIGFFFRLMKISQEIISYVDWARMRWIRE